MVPATSVALVVHLTRTDALKGLTVRGLSLADAPKAVVSDDRNVPASLKAKSLSFWFGIHVATTIVGLVALPLVGGFGAVSVSSRRTIPLMVTKCPVWLGT